MAGMQLSIEGNAAMASMAVCLFGLALQQLAMEEEEGGPSAWHSAMGEDIALTIDKNYKNRVQIIFLYKLNSIEMVRRGLTKY